MKHVLATLLVSTAIIGLAPLLAAHDRPYLRISSEQVRLGAPGAAHQPTALTSTASLCAHIEARAWHNQSVSGGGTLYPLAFMNPTTIDPSGHLYFMSQVQGVSRNQGIFRADVTGIQALVMGCGGGGGSGNPGTGCGDPTPVGGTFSGFFGGTMFAPAVNAGGDALFIADVDSGSAPRGLFLYQSASGTIVKVAAVGDTSPLGGTFSAIGPGSINSSGTVVFLATTGSGTTSDIFKWQGGSVTKVVAVGDPVPGGGTFTYIGTEALGFADSTWIPGGPVPDLTESGQIAFRGIVSGGLASRGMFVSDGTTHQWYVKVGETTPAGGTYFDFWGPIINEAGEMAFLSDYKPTPSTFSAAWFAGKPGSWRKALGFNDPMEGGTECWGLAASRNPMSALDDHGNLVMWANAKYPGGTEEERLVISGRDGILTSVASQGDPTPLGGTLGTMQSWPSMNSSARCGLSAATPGSSALNAHMLASDILVWRDLGFGLAGTSGVPGLVGSGPLLPGSAGALDLEGARPNAAAYFILSPAAANMPFRGGTMVPSMMLPPVILPTSGTGTVSIPWGAWPPAMAACTSVYFQAWIVDPAGPFGAAASNGLEAISR